MITPPISRYRQIAGDKCVVGSETFFLPIEAECPVVAPGDIDLMVSKASEVVNKSITFNFTQGQVLIYLPISIYIYIYMYLHLSIHHPSINLFIHYSFAHPLIHH